MEKKLHRIEKTTDGQRILQREKDFYPVND